MNKLKDICKGNRFTASLHTHVRSLYDADIGAKKLCEAIGSMGGKGCAITDHGVVSAIEDYRTVFSANELKLIPGCELYIDGGILGRQHLVVLAVNDNGWKGICKIVTEANKTLDGSFPVISQERLFDIVKLYRGDIIALSACMQGVICNIFRLNNHVNQEIGKIRRKQEKYLHPESKHISNAQIAVEKAKKELEEAITKRDNTKVIAEQRFAKREKAVASLETKGDEEAVKLRKDLEADKKAAQEAKILLPEVKSAVDKQRKLLSQAEKKKTEVTESVNMFLSYENQILELSKELKREDELFVLANETAKKYQEAFGQECFYAEMQYHGIKEEEQCFKKTAKLAKELHIPFVATNDVHILADNEEERLKRQVLKSLRFGKKFEEEEVGDSELYLKDNYTLAESLLKILPEDVVEESIGNIDTIFDRCNVNFCTEKHYPKFSQTEDANKLLEKEVQKGILWRFPKGMDEEHQKRLAYELPIIQSMGYADYHLIVKDFLEYGRLLGYVPKKRLPEVPYSIPELKEFIKENGWKNPGYMIGPGRGSAVGSLVCYLLGITALDPLKYDLLFERFLNPERISMPDIDSDIGATTRPYVIRYVQKKYGEMAVCGIMTTTMQAPKGSIGIAAKFYGLKKCGEAMTSLGRSIAKDVPVAVGVSFSTKVTKAGNVAEEGDENTLELSKYLMKKYEANKDAIEIISWAIILEGTFTAYGAHAAGIVISDNNDVSEYLPLRMNNGMFTTQCDMIQVEDNGLLKFDFLGLKTLDIITETMRMIEENHGIIIDPYKIDLTDAKVYKEILASGKTKSVFQLESDGMRTMLKRFKPTCFEDLIILVSMYRPGPLQYLDGVIDVKNGKIPMTFLCPELEAILGKTYGAIVYQEQVMQIFQSLAGYTLGGADQVRRYMSKKKADKLALERDSFIWGDKERCIKGCIANGISEETAIKLFEQMSEFAKYAFNKSHAAVYAFNAYITAWLKCYYPAEFFASALNWAETKKISGLMYEAISCDVKVYAPDVNLSGKEFYVPDGSIRFGLSSVAGVKDHADEIIEERTNGEFSSLKDFCLRVRPNAAVINNLIAAGAFDCFGSNRKAMQSIPIELSDVVSKRTKKASFVASAEYVLPHIESFTSNDELIKYQTDAGFKAELKELTTSDKLKKRIENAKNALANMDKEISLIRLHDCKEDKTERMAEERKFLGMYVTQHPMDFYPKATELNVPLIADIKEETRAIYGVITNLSIKGRKKDGAKMAFFTLEDKSGSIDVAVFTSAYAVHNSKIAEGNVVKLTGIFNAEEREEGEIKLTFFAENVKMVSEKLPSYMMHVSSYAVFHLEYEDTFKETYADEKGHPFLIFDKAMDEIREMNYRVSESAKKLPNVKEVY